MKSIQTKTVFAFLIFMMIFLITHFAYFPGSLAYFKEAANQQPLLDLKPEFSVAGLYQRLESFGDEGRSAYLKLIPTIDLIFPLSAFVFLLLLGRLAREKYQYPVCAGCYWIMPSIYLVTDFLENSLIVIILLHYPQQLDYPASVLGYISIVKRFFMMASLFLPLLLLAVARVRSYRARALLDRNSFSAKR